MYLLIKGIFNHSSGRKIIPFLIFSIILINHQVLAQNRKKHQIGFHLGLGRYEIRDNLVSPLMYSGNRIPFQLFYQYEGMKNHHYFQILYNSGELRSSVNNWIDETRIGFQYGYQRFVSTLTNKNLRLFIGCIWDHFFSQRISHLRLFSSGHLYSYSDTNSGELFSSLNLSLSGQYQIHKDRKIALQTFLPVVAFIVRPEYSLGPPESVKEIPSSRGLWEVLKTTIKAGELVTINEYFFVNIIFFYEVVISNHINLRYNYSFRYYRYSKPQKTGTVINEVGINIIFLF